MADRIGDLNSYTLGWSGAMVPVTPVRAADKEGAAAARTRRLAPLARAASPGALRGAPLRAPVWRA